MSLVVFPESDPSIFYGVFDTLWAAGRLWRTLNGAPPPNVPLFEPRLVGAAAGPLKLVVGVSIIAQDAVETVCHSDIVLVLNSAAGLRALDRALLNWLRRSYRDGARRPLDRVGNMGALIAGRHSGRTRSSIRVYGWPRDVAQRGTCATRRPSFDPTPVLIRCRGRTWRLRVRDRA